MTEDLSLKHSPSIADIDITNVEDVLTTIELDYSDLCGMDTLLRIDEAPEILSCKHCIFQEMIIDDGDVVCPIRVIGGFFLIRKGII